MEPDPNTTDVLRRVRTVEIKTRRLVTELLAGQYRSAFKGRGTAFDQVRPYVPGDDVRHLDWNVTARAGRPHVKEFVEERQLTALLLVDASASGVFGSEERSKREVLAELACSLAMSAVATDDRVGLVLFTDRIEAYVPPRRGRNHALRIVREVLARPLEGRGTDLAGALDFANRVTRKRGVCFLLSDLQVDLGDPAVDDALTLAGARHDLVALQVRDPVEDAIPDVGAVAVEDAETGTVVRLDTSSPDARARFAALAKARQARVADALTRAGGQLLTLRTDRPWAPELSRFFAERTRRTR